MKFDGTISRQVKLREGVPQGGVVSRTLFLVYMNDITTTVPRHVSKTLHADDFSAWCAEEHTTTAVRRIQNTINEVCNSLRTLSDNNRVVLQWVPAHVGIAGSETADRLAKAAAKLPQPHFSTSYKEVQTLLKQKQKSAWRLRNNGYDPQKDQVNTLDRRTQTTIFCLHTGHCVYSISIVRKHLKRLGLADSTHCECGSEEQTPEHILQTCPHQEIETVRQQFWPEDTEVGTKLWGQAAKLQQTADFLAATVLRI